MHISTQLGAIPHFPSHFPISPFSQPPYRHLRSARLISIPLVLVAPSFSFSQQTSRRRRRALAENAIGTKGGVENCGVENVGKVLR